MTWLLIAWRGIQRGFKASLAYPWQAALVASLCLSLWLYGGRQVAWASIAKRDQTITRMEAASKIATAVQIALNKAVTDKQRQIARMIDNDQTTRRNIADRSNNYANRMRADGYCRKASATAEDSLAEDNNPTSADAVVLSRADFNTLTDNTARLVQVKAWSDDLVGHGLAVPVD